MSGLDFDFSRTVCLRLDPNSPNAAALVQREGIIPNEHTRSGNFERHFSAAKSAIRSVFINDF
jgi:hypothetical protein